MKKLLKIIFVVLVVRPLVLIFLGLNVIGRKNLPTQGPAIIAANHNSHLDTLVLLSLYPLRQLHRLRPVAAADYFLKNKYLAWFALNVIGIIPLSRSDKACNKSLFSSCHQALDQGDILIVFPEGTRGTPEKIGSLKRGIFHLVRDRHDTPIVPVITHGLGRALPKGEALFVPFNCDIVVGEPLPAITTATELMDKLSEDFQQMLPLCPTYYTVNGDETSK